MTDGVGSGLDRDDATSNIRLRSYQHEMLEESIERNVIVAMDTGSGKTHIAVARIAAELEQCDNSMLVWFISPNVALSNQQYEVIRRHLPRYQARLLIGADNVDRWTDQALWDAVLFNIRIVVSTPAVLGDALTHGFVKMEKLALCIFDEAHHCHGKSPMNAIMRGFYHPAKVAGLPVPHILGLSASPVMNSKGTGLEAIEDNLDATVITPKRHRTDLLQYVHRPELLTIFYSADGEPSKDLGGDTLRMLLSVAVQNYDLNQDPYVLELIESTQQGDQKAYRSLNKVFTKRKTDCLDQLRTLHIRAEELSKQLGPWAAEWYVCTCINRFLVSFGNLDTGMLLDVMEREKRHLADIFIALKASVAFDEVTLDVGCISKKAEGLVNLLLDLANADFQGIIFVEQRATVAVLAEVLANHSVTAAEFSVGTFVGTSQSSKRKGTIADLVEPREQQEHLEGFRTGNKNLMIATSVLEEGIDISSCNAVICFDPPKNLVSFVQRRGRARKHHSKFILMESDDNRSSKLEKWQALEGEMVQAYMSDLRALNAAQNREDIYPEAERIYRVDSTGAVLTTENAKAHLYHFCARSTTHSHGVDSRPEFLPREDNATGFFSASATLPTFIHHSVRTASSTQACRSERAAIKDAAFEACIMLHKAGLLNDHILPLVKELPSPDSAHVDQPSLVWVSQQMDPWMDPANELSSSALWYAYRVTLASEGKIVCSLSLMLPTLLPALSPIKLYWNASTSYDMEVCSTEEAPSWITSSDLVTAQTFTLTLLASVHGSRMSGALDLIALFIPCNSDSDSLDVMSMQGSRPLIDTLVNCENPDVMGLLRVRNQAGRPYICRGQYTAAGVDSSARASHILAIPFPKRRDFLHPMATAPNAKDAHTAVEELLIKDCTVDSLPGPFSLFSAFVPSVLHSIEVVLVAQALQRTILSPVGIEDLSLVKEAISSAAAREVTNYERQEYLGDSILKFCAHLQLLAQHLTWPEGYLTVEKSRTTSNNNLAKAAIAIGLDSYVLTKPFTGLKWRPTHVSELLTGSSAERREMSSKMLADVVEALIGASFVSGGLPKALECIRIFLHDERWESHNSCFRSILADIRPAPVGELDTLEELIGHHFTSAALLIEAISHASYPYTTGSSYERLEFLGDAVLDLIVVPKLHSHARKLKHWEMHNARQALCNAHFMGFCCMAYSIDQERWDIVNKQPGDIETGFVPERRFKPFHLYDFLRVGASLVPLRRDSLASFEKLREPIKHAFEHGSDYPWPSLFALKPHKVFSDLIESVLGALYIDTRGDLTVCEAFLERLGVLPYMRRILDEGIDTAFPKQRVGILADKAKVEYVTTRHECEKQQLWSCSVKVGEENVVTVTGCGSKDEAEVAAADSAVKILMVHDAFQ